MNAINTLNAVHAIVRNGQIELEESHAWPDGTRLVVQPLVEATPDDSDEPNSPEEIARLLAARTQSIPFDYTPEEEARLEAIRQERKDWEKANFNERADKLSRIWE